MDNLTNCPNCGAEKSISEYLSCFGCSECGQWGPSPDRIIYEPEVGEVRESGQVCRKPRAA